MGKYVVRIFDILELIQNIRVLLRLYFIMNSQRRKRVWHKYVYGSSVHAERDRIMLERYKRKATRETVEKIFGFRIFSDNTVESRDFEEAILEDKAKKNSIAILGLFFSVLIYSLLYFVFEINVKFEIFFVITVMIVMVVMNQMIITYRMKKGIYGTNYTEAKEILYFIKEYSKNNQDINKGKKVFDEASECQFEGSGQLEYI